MSPAAFLPAIRLVLCCLLLWGTAASSSDGTMGRVLVVAQDGTARYSEIQTAIDEAKAGDTIIIKAGNYKEDVVVHGKSRLILRGEARDQVIIRGSKRVGAFRVGKWPYGATQIEIRDLTVSENGGLAMGIFNGSHVVLANLRVKGLLYVQQATDVRIERSHLGGSETTGVSFADAQAELLENEIRDNDYGVTIAGKSAVRMAGNVIRQNLIAGVVIQAGARGELIRNTIVQNGSGVAILDNASADLTGNVIGANQSGIQVASDAKVTLAFNAVRNEGPDYARPGMPPVPAPELRPDSDLAEDPRFVDPIAGDFRLRSDSPLVQRGRFEFLGALPPVSSLP
jgi:nitrous oxidase accessory protein NosD